MESSEPCPGVPPCSSDADSKTEGERLSWWVPVETVETVGTVEEGVCCAFVSCAGA